MTDGNEPHIHFITGHYGSGKTEFALNYALYLKERHENVAVVDLDIVNLYFRSREYEEMLGEHGIRIYGSAVRGNQVDVPALAASINAPLMNQDTQVVVDVGGNPVGARVLGFYKDQLENQQVNHLFVLNRNRPETATLAQAEVFMKEIAALARAPVNGLVNSTHLLKETSADDILFGQELCLEVGEKYNIPIRFVACRSNVCSSLPTDLQGEIFPLEIFMRQDWMK